MNFQSNKELMRRFLVELWNNRRIEVLDELLSPDIISHHGHAEINGIREYRDLFVIPLLKAFPDMQLEITELIECGDNVISRWHAKGTHKGELMGVQATGNSLGFSGMSWTKFQNGKFKESWNSWNMNYFISQLLKEISTLKRILPICCVCGVIRDDTGVEHGEGEWVKIEKFITNRTELDLSHTYCPACYGKQLDEIKNFSNRDQP